MKKTITLIALVAVMVISTQSWAQEQGKIRAGGGLAIGTAAGLNSTTGASAMGLGINLGGEYFITDVISVAPSYTFFFKSSSTVFGSETSYNYSSINIDGKYYFLTEGVAVYGLAGLSIGTIKTKVTFDPTIWDPLFFTDQTYSGSSTGINIGGGADYALSDKAYLNGQIKYNTPLKQVVINLGIGFNIN